LELAQGIQTVRETVPPKVARLRKRLHRVEKLPPADQKAVLKFVDGARPDPPPKRGRGVAAKEGRPL
jgi:hypothetical protein